MERWMNAIDLFMGLTAAAVYVLLIVRIVNWWQKSKYEPQQKRGAMFWITVAILATIALTPAAVIALLWLAIHFK
jgi:hypothetical protein